MSSNHDERIDSAPLTSREELLKVVFGDSGDEVFGADSKAAKAVLPRAEEWLDLADAGPFVDEMSVPVYTDAAGNETYGNPDITRAWTEEQLADLPRVGRTGMTGQAEIGLTGTE